MKNVLLNNGKIIPILSKDDALEVIRENLSSDLASYLSYIIEDIELEEEEMEQLEEDNMRLESENEQLRNLNNDLEYKAAKLENGIESLLSKLENSNAYNKEETEELLETQFLGRNGGMIMIWTRLYNVVGMDDLEGTTFARCTTYEKAQKAKEILEAEGFEGVLDIVQDEIPVDVIEVDSQLLEL